MITTNNKTDLQKFTRLPLQVIQKADGVSPTIIVNTPMNEKTIELKRTHYPFIFGSVTETEKNLHDIVRELQDLEKESMDYLFQGWLIREKGNNI